MTELPYAEDFKRLAATGGGAVEGALLVSRLIRPATDPARCQAVLDDLAAEVGEPASAERTVDVLRAAGFAGAEEYYRLENSALSAVLETRRGIPITLAVVAIGVAESAGLPAHGVNFPGHFLAALDGALLDPFAMRFIDAAEQRRWLARAGGDAGTAFRLATPVDIVLRMLNNLRMLAASHGDHARALTFSDYQLLLAPRSPALHVERAQLWLAVGATALARAELEQALEAAPEGALRERIVAELDATRAPPTLH